MQTIQTKFLPATNGRWLKAGGTWSLVRGHRDERNPHF